MREFTFASNGSQVVLEVSDKFLDLVAKRFDLSGASEIQERHVRDFFAEMAQKHADKLTEETLHPS